VSTYLDTSFLVSLYSPDSNYRKASNLFPTAKLPILVSALCELEAANSFRLCILRKDVTLEEARLSNHYLELDLKTRILERRPLPNLAFERSHQISSQHAVQLGTRTADLLHVAAALEFGADEFFSFDLQQRKLAAAAGLTLNPI
jgi:predicted nucleic acid-binding protein